MTWVKDNTQWLEMGYWKNVCFIKRRQNLCISLCNHTKRKMSTMSVDSTVLGSIVHFLFYGLAEPNSSCFLFSLYIRCSFALEPNSFLPVAFDFESPKSFLGDMPEYLWFCREMVLCFKATDAHKNLYNHWPFKVQTLLILTQISLLHYQVWQEQKTPELDKKVSQLPKPENVLFFCHIQTVHLLNGCFLEGSFSHVRDSISHCRN